jgi:hypothetical protein
MKLRAPASGSFKFYLEHDDGSKLWFDGVEKINREGTKCI